MAPAAADESPKSCRICFSGDDEDTLISPCRCTGTQKFVHEGCLRQWQKAARGTAGASVCGVCRSPFTLAPPREPWLRRAARWVRDVGAACAAVAAAAAAAMGSLSALQVLALGPILSLVALWFSGLQFAVVGDGRLALVRAGRPVEGLHGGIFLVSHGIERGVFGRSVILLAEHDARGSFGFVVNKETDETAGGFALGSGGPVGRDMTTLLYRAPLGPVPGGRAIWAAPPGVRIAAFPEFAGIARATRQLASAGARSSDVVAVRGYAGWGPRQLDGEVRAGAWRVVPFDADELFVDHGGAELWQRLFQRAVVPPG